MAVVKSPSAAKRYGMRILVAVFVIAITVAITFPIYAVVLQAFEDERRGGAGTIGGGQWTPLPKNFTTENVAMMFSQERGWAKGFQNSIMISLINTALCLLIAFPTAYMFTRTTFRFDRHLYFFVIMQRMTPPGAFIIPTFMIYTGLGIYDTIPAVVIAHSIFNLPLAVWILSGFMKDIPTTIDEQAFIDGYSTWGFWRRIYLPLLLPAIGVTAFFLWMFSWTELMLGNAVTRNDAYPMTVNLLVTIGSWSHGVMYSQSAAAGFVSMIPGIVVLFFVRTQIARGFMLGGRPGE